MDNVFSRSRLKQYAPSMTAAPKPVGALPTDQAQSMDPANFAKLMSLLQGNKATNEVSDNAGGQEQMLTPEEKLRRSMGQGGQTEMA